jgi:hypothetical protein
MTNFSICKMLGCDKPLYGFGFCRRHYDWLRCGRITSDGKVLISVRQKGGRRCKIEGCDREYHGTGFCEYHRTQYRRGIIDSDGKIVRDLKSGKALEKCRVDGCVGSDDGKGFCSKHRYQYREGIIDTDGKKLKLLEYEKEFDYRSQHKKSEEFVLNRYFGGGPLCRCSVCGGDFEFYLMDGHHPDRSIKTMTPTTMMSRAIWKHSEMIAELDSLKWMCCHCHLVVEVGGEDVPYSVTNVNKVGKARDKVMEIIFSKYGRECLDCHRHLGRRTVIFHHRDPSQKLANISQSIGFKNFDFVMAEVEKCDLLCSLCHRKRHHWDKELRGKTRPWTIRKGRQNRIPCMVSGCEDKYWSRGFCPYHYQQFYKGIIDSEGKKLREFKARVA